MLASLRPAALLSFCSFFAAGTAARSIVVADYDTHLPLAHASVFNSSGNFLGVSERSGTVNCASAADYPLTIRYLGYDESSVASEAIDTVFLREAVSELDEVIVQGKEKRMLHVLAYVREYSTLSSYTDTIGMFREKMVDFMLPTDGKTRFRGWRTPRILNSRSYYRFTDSDGLDSVSDRCHNYFTWADWVGMLPEISLPEALTMAENAVDTLRGKYSAVETWRRRDDRISIDVDVLADTVARRWVPNIASFFRNGETDFERFNLRVTYGNVMDAQVDPLSLTAYSFNIESRGRGHNMFMFHRADQPFFVTTYSEVYILDKEFITVREAKKWAARKFDGRSFEILEPEVAPDLQPAILALIDRVNNIDSDRVRSSIAADTRLKSRNVHRNRFGLGYRALSILKDITGISTLRARKHFNDNWRNFRNDQKARNRQEQQTAGPEE